ncbi:MAG: hypothetical protein H6759_04935 [Candidatus Nomurabacteria bacterium]|nr:MAG: hypothetical protein H6759_04935 [Candidatus Nomurabacteria bacterium]
MRSYTIIGDIPSITDIHQEGVRRKNPLFVNKHGIISIKGLADLIAEMEIPIMSLQTERHNEYEYLSSHTSLSPSSRALIHELHANAKGLLKTICHFLSANLVLWKPISASNIFLLEKTYKDAGSIHQLSRERVRKIISVQIPECFSELGWHSPSILSELAAITLLTYEFCGDTPSPILERLSNLNHELTEVSLFDVYR